MAVQGPNALDFSGFAALRKGAKGNDQEVLREVARQFESLFTNMMLKNMRAASFGDPLTGSSEQDGYRDMFDQQMAVEMSRGRGLGIADMLVRQLSGTVASGLQQSPTDRASGIPLERPQSHSLDFGENKGSPVSREDFVAGLWPHARRAGRDLGVDPRVIVAQAALETGWGRSFPGPAVSPAEGSNNLFGIKADAGWQGRKVAAETLEFSAGALRRSREDFRAYDSKAQSVSDYVAFLKDNPRYQAALAAGDDARSFARGLQAAGYATDPDYAEKLMAVMESSPIRDISEALKFSAVEPITTADAALSRVRSGPPESTRS